MSRHPAVGHFIKVLERVAPLSLADRSWDNVGLLLESPTVKILSSGACRVLLTIDLTEPVYKEAVAKKVSIILSYHPPWFRGEKSLTLEHSRGMMRMVALCASSGISIYSPHSALDALSDGINSHVGQILGKSGISSSLPIIPASAPFSGSPTLTSPSFLTLTCVGDCGVGRIVTLTTPVTFRELVKRWTMYVGIPHIRVAFPEGKCETSLISTIAICVGSGASVLDGVKADLFFTGEMSHHDILKATIACETAVILTEHTNCERGYLKDVLLPVLTDQLNQDEQQRFEIIVSSVDRDPITIISP